jgi:transposase
MAAIHSDEFKRDAVRIATTSGLTKRQVASDSLAGRRLPSIAERLGVGLSTLNKWVKMVSDEAGPSDPDQNLLRENERLRRENRILKEERELLKKATQFFAAQKP